MAESGKLLELLVLLVHSKFRRAAFILLGFLAALALLGLFLDALEFGFTGRRCHEILVHCVLIQGFRAIVPRPGKQPLLPYGKGIALTIRYANKFFIFSSSDARNSSGR